jgi:hypothetical protein
LNQSAGCTWAGSGSHQPSSADVISVNWPQQRYRASHSVPNTFHFTVTRTCNGQPADIDFFPASQLVNTKWLDSHGAR